jgi:SHS2 domain-containing protein
MGYRFVEHTSEVEVALQAASEAGIFAEAAVAFAELVGDQEGQPAARVIELDGSDRALLLVDWLNELVFLAEVERFVPGRVTAFELTGDGLRAALEGRRGEPRHLVKAVTLNKLRFEQVGGAWHAVVVLDV